MTSPALSLTLKVDQNAGRMELGWTAQQIKQGSECQIAVLQLWRAPLYLRMPPLHRPALLLSRHQDSHTHIGSLSLPCHRKQHIYKPPTWTPKLQVQTQGMTAAAMAAIAMGKKIRTTVNQVWTLHRSPTRVMHVLVRTPAMPVPLAVLSLTIRLTPNPLSPVWVRATSPLCLPSNRATLFFPSRPPPWATTAPLSGPMPAILLSLCLGWITLNLV